jgi:hypothetical protein
MATQQFVWTLLAGAFVLFWLSFAVLATPKIDTAGAIVVMQYGRWLGLMSLIFALAPPTLLVPLAWNVPWKNGQALAMVGVSFLALSLLAGLLLIEVVRVHIVLTTDGITRHSPWTGSVSVKWSEVKRVRFSPLNRWFVIVSDSATIRVSLFLTGQKEFTQALLDNIAVEKRIGCEVLSQ